MLPIQYSEWSQGSVYYRRQLVMFIVDKVVEELEDRHMLLVNELESITLLDGTTPALCPAARDPFAIFEDLCLTESVRNSYNSSASKRPLFLS
jgi:hypothetical protein